MKKVLVTGANGYIGKHVVKTLLNSNIEVITNDISLSEIDDKTKKINLDIFSKKENIFEELGSPDVCIHLAWQDGFIHNSDAHIMNLSAHYCFIKNMVAGGLKQLVVMGTMHEVGYHEGVIDENTICKPLNMYGIAKNTLRESITLLLKEKDVAFQWLRGFYIYGDDERSNSIFNKIYLAEKAGEKTFPFTSGKNKYDFIGINDFAEQIVACALQKEIQGIINCCSGKPITLAEKIENYIKENNLNIKLDYGKYPDRPYDSPAVWGDTSKIRRIMGQNI